MDSEIRNFKNSVVESDNKNTCMVRKSQVTKEILICVNKVHPLRTNKEYNEDNKEDIGKNKKEVS